jgi:hypothetical protein
VEQTRHVPSGPQQKRQAPLAAQAPKEAIQRASVYIANIGIASGRTAEFTVVVGWNTHGNFT